jgi:hypothetical protein
MSPPDFKSSPAMPGVVFNVETLLNFSGVHISGLFVSNPRDYKISKRSIVVNPNRTTVHLAMPSVNVLTPFTSVILQDVSIADGESVIILQLDEATNLGNIFLEDGWVLCATLVPPAPMNPDPGGPIPFARDTPLWKSSQHLICRSNFDPALLPGQDDFGIGVVPFDVKVNLWFAPANTNCFIHNQHAFIEIHTQVTGCGSMQKFHTQSYGDLYLDEKMAPGFTTTVPYCEIRTATEFIYPWHQYFAETDCIWMAIEYHPA